MSRLFNKGNKEVDPYVVDLVELARGRPRLETGVDGEVIPVFEDQPSSIIAYSLCSKEYHNQFKDLSDSVVSGRNSSKGENRSSTERRSREDITVGALEEDLG